MSDWLIEELLGDDDYIPQPDEYDDDPEPKSLGGPGSGNFGHAGRPGEIGGSALAAEGNRIFKTRDDLKLNKGWYGEKDYYTWKDKPGMMVTGRVLDKAELPDTLYHVTTNATAVESSGYLRGQNADVGLGGGQEDGVSFTTDLTDAKVIQRELRRAVEIAQQKHTIESLDRFAREDEQEAGMAEGSLNDAVNYARRNWDVNITSPVYDSEQKKASLLEDVFKMYLQIRGNSKDPLLKNPMLFGRQEHLRNLDPNNIRTLHVPKSGIPDRALVTSGSDDFLHEVRVYSDVPVAGMRVAGGPGSGNFGHAGRPGEIGGSAPAAMPAHAKETLDAWIADSDYAINAAARSKQDSALVKQMDEVIAASPVVDGTVYRGVSLDPEDPNQRYILDNLKKGYSFGEKGFSSVTSNEKIATDFATGGNTGNVEVVFEMKVSGRRGAVVPSGLDETVLERGITYKIDKVVRKGSRVKVTGRIF